MVNADVNGCAAVKTIAAFGFAIRQYSRHNGSNGITESHAQLVVPYGKSHRIISTDADGTDRITSKQSPSAICPFPSVIIRPPTPANPLPCTERPYPLFPCHPASPNRQSACLRRASFDSAICRQARCKIRVGSIGPARRECRSQTIQITA